MPSGQYPQVLAGQSLTADLLEAMVPWQAWKTGNTPRASTVTLAADPDLSVPVAANATYEVTGILGYTAGGPVASGGAGGINFTLAAPAGSSGGWSADGWGLGTTLVAGVFPFTAFATTTPPANSHSLNGSGGTQLSSKLEGTLITGSTPGSLVLWWCQAGADGTATVLLAGSRLKARRTG